MLFTATDILGVTIVGADRQEDARGHFTRIFCADEFAEQHLELPIRQAAISHNRRAATLRGLHFIPEELGEAKLVRCIRGRIFDVAVDVRPGSQTFGCHFALELSAERQDAIYLPRGVAHGFLTIEDDCEVLYQFSEPHRAGVELGVRWDDPDIAIKWPLEPAVISSRDRALPLLAELNG
jgi:dTDP-4-dehydrorhamnose 3,5-epimerase